MEYTHYPKQLTPREELVANGAHLKWYDLERDAGSIDPALRESAREFLCAEADSGRLDVRGDLGFVILHRCGGSFYFLIVCTWRNANELWETVYAKEGDEPFALFPQGTHKGTYCVWELGAVLHEQMAWTRYLYSPRDASAVRDYLGDQRSGTV
ncbi:MAG: hypothetical protein JO197_03280 [Acidobacteria bacterium]|nr:hypothetical protein [Acidobacteriota bacterium]MBV9476594.1 hypothetical protein [Acidobacteriota bacterium]